MKVQEFKGEPSETIPLVVHVSQNYPRRTSSSKVFLITFGLVALLSTIVLWKYHFAVKIVELYSQSDVVVLNRNTVVLDLEIQVDVDQGRLQGKQLLSRAGRNYLAFLGIPYAQPPIEELRFQPPVAPESWKGIRDSTYFRSACIEKARVGNEKLEDQPDVTLGSEDCLYLNVYTPKEPADLNKRRNRFPVMVYIHGGAGGAFGTGQKYGADYFMDEDVVLITLEFRLGILGNLNTHTRLASGNQAFKDQIMALQWVQDNIGYFGGDKNKVTIFGNSFGGIQISAHMLSPLGKGLYHRAITQSGTLLYPGFFTDNPLHDASRLGDLTNCSSQASNSIKPNLNEELTKCLMNLTASDLVIQSLKIKNKYNYVFTVSVDTASEPGNVFLPLGPMDSLQAGSIKSIPYLTGIVDAEGLKDSLEVMTDPVTLNAFQHNWTEILVPSLYLQYTTKELNELEEITTNIRQFYLDENKNETKTTLDRSNFENFTNIFTDRLYTHPAATVISFMLQKYNQTAGGSNDDVSSIFGRQNIKKPNTYFYHFTHEVEISRADPIQEKYDGNQDYFGECHADELQFFFPFDAFPYIPMDHPYQNFSQMVVRLWVNFAKTGVPTGADNNATWHPVTDEHPYQYFQLNDDPKMSESELAPRIQFWNQFNLTALYM